MSCQEMNHAVHSKIVKENLLVPGFPVPLEATGYPCDPLLVNEMLKNVFLSDPGKGVPHQSYQGDMMRKHLFSFHALSIII